MQQRKNLTIALLAAALVITAPAALTGGELAVSWRDLGQLLSGGCSNETVEMIILELRLPRVILAILCGAALGISGAVLQSVLHNPLASPDLLGITAGGGCAALITLLFFPALLPVINITVFAGAFLTALLIYAAAWKYGVTPGRLLLAGVAAGALLGTVTTLLLMLFPERFPGVFNFMLGGFSGKSFLEVKLFLPGFILCFVMAALMRRQLDILSLGGTQAAALGAELNRSRIAALSCAALGAAGAAGVAGMIGFAGLIAPHTVRTLGSSGSHRFLLPASALAGAELVLLSDWLGRVAAFENVEIPAGVFLGGAGALFFLVLLLGRREGEL